MISADNEIMPERHLCPRCIGVGTIVSAPEGRAWLRRKDLETGQDRYHGFRAYEMPGGELYQLPRPYKIRVQCPVCNPRRFEVGIANFLLQR